MLGSGLRQTHNRDHSKENVWKRDLADSGLMHTL